MYHTKRRHILHSLRRGAHFVSRRVDARLSGGGQTGVRLSSQTAEAVQDCVSERDLRAVTERKRNVSSPRYFSAAYINPSIF